jgi:hypothetical protein
MEDAKTYTNALDHHDLMPKAACSALCAVEEVESVSSAKTLDLRAVINLTDIVPSTQNGCDNGQDGT